MFLTAAFHSLRRVTAWGGDQSINCAHRCVDFCDTIPHQSLPNLVFPVITPLYSTLQSLFYPTITILPYHYYSILPYYYSPHQVLHEKESKRSHLIAKLIDQYFESKHQIFVLHFVHEFEHLCNIINQLDSWVWTCLQCNWSTSLINVNISVTQSIHLID